MWRDGEQGPQQDTPLLLTYRLTWDSSSGSFVGQVWRGWMPKERDDFAFQRRVCASWLPQDPLVSGSISGPGGWGAVLREGEGYGAETQKRGQPHHSPIGWWPIGSGGYQGTINPEVSREATFWAVCGVSHLPAYGGTAWDLPNTSTPINCDHITHKDKSKGPSYDLYMIWVSLKGWSSEI